MELSTWEVLEADPALDMLQVSNLGKDKWPGKL